MAKPSKQLEVWAKTDLNLPVTGKANKQRPIDDLWEKGFDRGQKPSCEEFNYVLNMLSIWVKYLTEEGLPSYLPINGTKITFTGDLSGNATWSGSSTITANIQVLDNSHNHISANISDATPNPTPNMLVKRSGDAAISAGDIYSYATSPTDQATFFLMSQAGQQIGQLSAESNVGGMTYMYRQNPTNGVVRGWVRIYDDGHTDISLPRTSQGQEGLGNSLVRYDYMWQQLNNTNNNVNNINNDLQSYKDGVYNSYVSDIRLGATYTRIIQKNTPVTADGGGVVIGYYFEGDNPQGDTLYIKPIQKAVGGNWYTIGQL